MGFEVRHFLVLSITLTFFPVLVLTDKRSACKAICGEFMPGSGGGAGVSRKSRGPEGSRPRLLSLAESSNSKPVESVWTRMRMQALPPFKGFPLDAEGHQPQTRGCFPLKNCIADREKRCSVNSGGVWCGELYPGCYCGTFRKVGAPAETQSYECVSRGGQTTCAWYDDDGHTCLEYNEKGQVTKCNSLEQGETG